MTALKIDEILLEKIDKEKEQWKKSSTYRTFEGRDKGEIIASLVKKHFKIGGSSSVNLNKILDEIGVTLNMDFNFKAISEKNDDIWGMWLKDQIYISKDIMKETSKRFTIAHELGHIFVDYNKGQDVYFRDKGFWKQSEVIVNDFAANLLVPKVDEDFLENLEKKGSKEIAKIYEVPHDTILILSERFKTRKRKF